MDKQMTTGDNGLANQKNFDEIIGIISVLGPDLIKYHLRKDGFMRLDNGIYLRYCPDDDKVLRVHLPNGNWFNVVKNYSVGSSRCNWKFVSKQVRHIMCRHYSVPDLDKFPTFNDWANDLKENGFCNSEKRLAKIRADYEAETAKYNA